MKSGAINAKGPQAARRRRRKRQLLARLRLPPQGLPGSLAQTHRRCGKPSCHCAEAKGHPVWSLTFMLRGRKRVERIPEEWVAWVQQRLQHARAELVFDLTFQEHETRNFLRQDWSRGRGRRAVSGRSVGLAMSSHDRPFSAQALTGTPYWNP